MEKELSVINDPLGERKQREPNQGVTMVIDKGLGVHHFKDLLENAGNYVDFVKLGFGTTALYPLKVLKDKIELAKKYGVDIYPGGTFFEVAFYRKETVYYFETMKELGFSKIEISDGTIELSAGDRLNAIQTAKKSGFDVITEYGKKTAGSTVDLHCLITTLEADLNAGASFVIVEGRESGENVGIYDSAGKMQEDFPILVKNLLPYNQQIIWEAPKKQQQVELMHWFGPNVHLGNIAPEEIYSVEALRRGLRSDTFYLNSGRKQS
jgi:phosphosulfolactate synthase